MKDKTQIESYLASVVMLSTSHLEEMSVNLRKAELNARMTGTKGLGLTVRIKEAVDNELLRRDRALARVDRIRRVA